MHEIGLNKKKTHVHVKSDLHKTQGCTKLKYQHICHTDIVVTGNFQMGLENIQNNSTKNST